jgi:hypothetical protein
MGVTTVSPTSVAIRSLLLNRKRNDLQNLPDGTEKIAIDANTNIPEVIQSFQGSLNQRKRL